MLGTIDAPHSAPLAWGVRALALAGMTNALTALVLLTANRPSVYLVGTALYLVTIGFCYSWYTALQAEIVGLQTRDASTLFSVLNAVGSLPGIYMIGLAGVGYRHFGTRGLLWTDAGANLLVCAVVLAVFVTCGLGLRRVPASQILTHEPSTS